MTFRRAGVVARVGALLVPCLLPFTGCGKTKQTNTDGGPLLPGPHGEPVRVAVLAPTVQTELTTLKATIDLEGVALGGATAVRWSAPGGHGTAEGTASWRATGIPLLAGENRIVLKGDAPAGSTAQVIETTVVVRRNAFLGLRGRPRLDPEAGFVGDTTDVIATVAVDMTGDVDPASLIVAQSDAHGGWSMAAKMLDDGDFAHSGDEIPGDGVYAGRFGIAKTQAGELTLAIQGKSKSGGAAQEIAAIGSVPFVSHLTATEYSHAADLVTGMQHAQDEHKSDGLTAATNAALAVATQDPNVAAAGISHEGSSVWVLTTAGIIGGTMSAHPDERGGVEVGNRGAFCASPASAALGEQDEGKAIAAALGASACPAYDVVAHADEGVTIERLRAMTNAGVVVLATHGATFDENSGGTPALDVHEFMLTGEVVTPEARAKYELDLKTHRLALGPVGADGKQRFLMTPKLIRSLGRFPGSIVYAGACRSFYAGEFATAFLEAGAGAYLGYTDIVKSAFAYQTGKDFFQCLLGGKSTGECWDPTRDDGGSEDQRGVKLEDGAIVSAKRQPARLKLMGRTDLTLVTATGLANAGFEEADDAGPSSVTPRSWQRAGDARAMSALGGYAPTEGARMGLVSTGLGFTQTNGELVQTFCIPAGVKTLSYDWNFISDEFKSYCGDPDYQDNLSVTLQERGAAEPTLVQSVRIDDLCETVGPSLFAVPDVNYTDMDGMSYATGWKRSASFDVSAFAGTGRPVTLRFALADKGDSIYDTVVLLDGLKLE
jgi:hypothetical protein